MLIVNNIFLNNLAKHILKNAMGDRFGSENSEFITVRPKASRDLP